MQRYKGKKKEIALSSVENKKFKDKKKRAEEKEKAREKRADFYKKK